MINDSHVDHLKEKKHDIEFEIEREEQRPMPDTIRISQLKREKLRIKDEIVQLDAG